MKARAAAEGWRLVTTFENVKGAKPRYDIARYEPSAFKNDQGAQRHVVERAKSLSVFHLNALKLVAASRLKETA